VTFSVVANGNPAPTYQWRKGGVNITGATGASYTIAVVALTDAGSYDVVVTNSQGSVTSTGAALTVNPALTPPLIGTHPTSQTKTVGDTVTFTVAATGNPVPTYQWRKGGVNITGATSASYTIFGVALTDAGAYDVVVTNAVSSMTSNPATLTVCDPVKVTAQSIGQRSVLTGAPVLFKMTASGTAVNYQWQKSADGTTFAPITGANADSISFAATKSDSGYTWRCIVSGQCGTAITGNTGKVLVYTPVKAVFGVSPNPATGVAPLTVAFSDSSTGDFTKRIWTFGDGGVDSAIATNKNLSHNFTTASDFTVKLLVIGPLRADSVSKQVFTYPLGSDPIQITGAYLTPQKVQIKLTGYGTINPPSTFVTADSVGLWYKVGALPATPAQGAFIKWYAPSDLRTRGSEYLDTLTLPALTGADSIYCIMNGILWSDKTISTFLAGNGDSVLMRDVMPITNDLNISGTYLPNDTARIFIGNLLTLDTSRVDLVGIWYGLVNGTPDFSDSNFTTWIPARTVKAGADPFSHDIINPAFNNVRNTMYAAVICVGKNKLKSAVKNTSFPVGKDRPKNPIFLKAKVLTSNTIRLTWNNISASGVQRMVIWYRADTLIPHVYDVSALRLDSLQPTIADTMIDGTAFHEKTKYYFGAQVLSGGLWSYITDSSSANAITDTAEAMLTTNSLAIVKPTTFDTLLNQIKVCWTVSAAQADPVLALQAGILYSADSMPRTDNGDQQMAPISGTSGCAYVKLRENLIFDKTYYISMWLRAPGGKWTPDSAGRGKDTVHVPMFTWQSVSYFAHANDTVFAFNDSLRFTNTPDNLSKTPDQIVDFVKPDPASLTGFIPVSIEFEFKVKDPGVPFFVGLKMQSLPAGYTIKDVRIYYRNADGLWVLDPDPLSVDTARGYVQVYTNQLDYPFVAMIDTDTPTVTVLSSISGAVPPDVGIKDTIAISDNIANLRWWFKSSKGDQSYATGDTSQFSVLQTTSDTIIVTIPRNLVSQDNGVRGMFTVSDGVHFVTADLSRRVVRDSSDLVWTEDQKWAPLSVSADLDTPETKKVLRSFAENGAEWKYDKTKFRIFKWYPNAGNAASKTVKWVEYADTLKQAFEFSRGNLIWVKTRTRTAVRFGKGVTAPLDTPFVLTLQPGQFTDFAPPFKFDITVGDILRRTRASMPAADTAKVDALLLYVWKKDKNGRYYTELRYSNIINDPKLNNSAQTCSADSWYSLNNTTAGDTIRLQIPPIPQAMSGILFKKAATSDGWAVKLVPSLNDGSSLTPVYCGYTKTSSGGVSYYPVAPSFGNAFAGIFERGSGTVHGHAVAHSLDNGGAAFLLAFCNDGQEPAIMLYHLENLSMLPRGMAAAIYDDVAGRYEDLSKGDLSVSVGADAKAFRWLFVGTQGYLAKATSIARPATLKLFGTYPNPFSSMVRIRYSLPYDGVEKVRFAIYDMRGRSVWYKEINAVSKYGASELVWNGRAANGQPVASGVYILRMTALNKGKKPAGVFEKKMTFMP
jgi:PKD repeat protein